MTTSTLPYLCHIVVERQALNTIRLRCNMAMNAVKRCKTMDKDGKAKRIFMYHFGIMYEELKHECKTMSAELSRVRKELRVKSTWGTTSNITALKTPDNTTYSRDDIRVMAENYTLDSIMFPSMFGTVKSPLKEYEKRYEDLHAALVLKKKKLRDEHGNV